MRIIFWVFCLMMISCSNVKKENKGASLKFPVAEKREHQTKIHGQSINDHYFWIRNREEPKVKEYLLAENNMLDLYLKNYGQLKDKIYQELKARIKDEDISVPEENGGYLYYSKDIKGKQYKVYYRKKGVQGTEETLLDLNELAQGKKFLKLGMYSISPDHEFLAYGLDEKGDEVYRVFFKNLTTGKILRSSLTNVSPGLAWANGHQKVYYTQFDKELRPRFVYEHDLDRAQKHDKNVYIEKDLKYFVSVENSRDDQYVFINSAGQTSNEVRLKKSNSNEAFRIFSKRKKDVEYSIDHHEGNFYVLTNDVHENFRLIKTGVEFSSKKLMTEVLSPKEDVLYESFLVFKNFLAVQKRVGGLTKIEIIDLKDEKNSHEVSIPGESYAVDFTWNLDYQKSLVRFSFSSLKNPSIIYDYNYSTRTLIELKRKEIPTYDPTQYEEKRVEVASYDGKKIPVSIMYKKELFKKNGKAPFYLIGYGAYGYSYDPSFLQNLVSLIDRGFAVGIAQIRGGSELGRSWYKDGKFLNKKNTFNDFISVAEFLKKNKWVHPEKLVISGRSAGGLLMGAVTNMRPDLFKIVVAGVPFVDLINTMLDSSLPLTTIEYEEWGDPHDKTYFDYMLSYSPYDNVKAQKYPYILATAGFTDPRVTYWEPAKWILKIRDFNQGEAQQFLYTDMESGHFGSSGRYDHLKEKVLEYTFVLKVLGMVDEEV